ncbi:glycerate kinase [Microbacterium sp. APC 3898]|uniref:Glycerate kinase n=2 Tax=Planococcus TaxID=1372 RepID=A0ABT7ZJ65_9BACL|nr:MULTISPECIES: glycerate kinase [Terrabacteria group]MBD8014331.1 glycerate kinase [Planococcus wigleyi]MBF6634216.1 glycerate kinase [Planococcus sp. (in: firmicutes)]MDN3427186.1 glycerate kinase [Planococcus sp. APC 4016]MDN3499465.1 glycerate kinase [Microbacterium sp. APC 3898]
MKIVIVPSGFKECLDAEDVAAAMDRGVRRFDPSINTVVIPMIDGGEGFVKTIINIKDGIIVNKKVTGPVGKKIDSYFGFYQENGKRIAVIEMAAVAGLKLVPHDERNPLKTTTYGVGELIVAALDFGIDHILIGCGDSGTSDGGAGMAQALGVQFFDKKQQPVQIKGGEDLLEVDSLLAANVDSRLKNISIDVACNWKNILCGRKGVARVFGPQKGATPKQVDVLSSALEQYAGAIQNETGLDVRSLPGSGASGGLGAGLLAFTNAILHPRFDIIMDFINIEKEISTADIVFTAEGSLDFQTPNGKIPSEVARIAKTSHIPVIAITGTIGEGAELNYQAGIDAYSSIIQKPVSMESAMINAPKWIEESTYSALRKVAIGWRMTDQGILKKVSL